MITIRFPGLLPSSTQELQYVEFFAGEANVFAKVKQNYPGTAVDFEYLKGKTGPGRSNAFDILGDSGMAFLDSNGV